jgi:hypothetical protein
MGSEWMEAGHALAPHDSAAATQAFIWARFCFSKYQDAWMNSAASRWDPDALDDIAAAEAAIAQLNPATGAMPPWATNFLKGIIPATDPSEDSPFLQKLAKIAVDFRALPD